MKLLQPLMIYWLSVPYYKEENREEIFQFLYRMISESDAVNRDVMELILAVDGSLREYPIL